VTEPTPPYEHLDPPLPDVVRLRRARARFADVQDAVDPSARGALGCGVAAVHAATWTLGIAFMVAPCGFGLALGGVVPAVVAFTVGGIVAWPLLLKASRRARAYFYETTTKNAHRLPERAGGGSSSTAAVGSQVDDGARRPTTNQNE
jgi:hypothetical protein